MTIHNIDALADYLQITVPELPHDVHEYTDYDTAITWTDAAVTLTTTVPEAEAKETTVLPFPFTDADYEDAIIGLQCWADYMYCEAVRKDV